MAGFNRRDFLASTSLVGAGLSLGAFRASAAPAAPPPVVKLSWLGDLPPRVSTGVAWGVPWPRGSVARTAPITVRDASGNTVPAQSWPTAYWPDGSIKWTGLAIAAGTETKDLSVTAGGRRTAAPKGLSVAQDATSVTIDTGAVTAVIAKSGEQLITALKVDGREVARNGRLVAIREDRAQPGTRRDESFTSKIARVTVEQSGPIRAVVKIEGTHSGNGRDWLPFTVRLYFTAGLAQVRLVHSFVFDGNQKSDFIKGLGIRFAVPFREEMQNRHVRIATGGKGNIFAEPVQLIPGYGRGPSGDHERAQIEGTRIPNLKDLGRLGTNIRETATWNSFKLSQLTADGWQLHKRTNADSSWLTITNGERAGGLAFLGDVSGGLAVGVKDFWQKYPSAFEIDGAGGEAGELTAWLWSPDAQPMDVRHYDTVGHSLSVTYEDYTEGYADALGAANTAELMLWATADTPKAETLAAMTETAGAPPLLICTPEHYYATRTLGYWSLPSQPVPGLNSADVASAEAQLDRAFAFYNGEIERRRWYGFWDYGDYRRTYDPIRHQWMYDIGGHGWNATELMPNVWLWFAFLRSGRADIFRAAEAMTRNNNEVDVHHIGRFAGAGSRHNVSHWGDAKEIRINTAFLKRFYYFLTTDERTGDLLREPVAQVEKTFAENPPLHKVEPRADIKPPLAYIRVGPDWLVFADNWLAEWERTGDKKYRDWCLTGMKDIGAMPDAFLARGAFLFDPATKHLKDVPPSRQSPSQFMYLFAGDQVAAMLLDLIDCPEFAAAWNQLAVQFIDKKRANWYFEPRVAAIAARATGRQDLEDHAIGLYRNLLRYGDKDYFLEKPIAFDGPGVTQPTLENPGNSTFAQALAVPEVSQWAINLISMPELLRAFRAGVPQAT